MPKNHGIRSFLRKRKYLAAILLVIVALFIVYKSDKIMIEKPQQLAEHIRQRTGLDFFPMWTKATGYLFRLEDDLNPFRIKKNFLDGSLPIYGLELNPGDLIHLDNISSGAFQDGYMSPEKNGWRNAKLELGGKRYDIKVRYHGDTPDHWANELKSYQIKSDKEEYINNMRRFNLIIFEDRKLTPMLARELAKKFGLMDVRNDIVVLKINGVLQGLYYLEEKPDADFLEYNKCPGCYIVAPSDNWVDDHRYDLGPYKSADPNGVFWETSHRTAFDYEFANLNPDDQIPQTALFSVKELYDSVNEKNPDVVNYFDKEYLSSFQAFRTLLGSIHSVAGDNLRMAYSPTNSKFYPLPVTEISVRLKLEKGGLQHFLNNFGRPIELFAGFARDDDLRYMTNKKLYQFLADDNTVIEEYEAMLAKYAPYAESYKTNDLNTRHMAYALTDFENTLNHNIKIIKSNLEYSKVYIDVIQKNNKAYFEIVPDSVAEIKFSKFQLNLKDGYSGRMLVNISKPGAPAITKSLIVNEPGGKINLLEHVSELYFSAGLDENLYPDVRRYKIDIIFEDAARINLDSVDIGMRNDITGRDIAGGDTYIQTADADDYYENSKYADASEVIRNFPQFRWDYNDGILKIMEGKYMLDKDLIIPKTRKFVLDAGVSIGIAENISVLSYSPVAVGGTRENPVVISALDKGRPFGVFAVVGDGTQAEKTTINWLDISGGRDKWINGMFFMGQLSVYHASSVYINNTAVHGSRSDDGINIKYADVMIENSKFYGNSADQVDMDFANGIVKNSEFNGRGELDGNGDGLDLSGSSLLIKNNVFANLLDKGISIGEGTNAVVYKNVLTDNTIGAAVKDLSSAYFADNVYQNNQVAISAYQKKQLFGGASAYVYKNTLRSNQKDFDQDTVSQIYKISNGADAYKTLRDNAEKEILDFPE